MHFTNTITIARPVAEVFAFLARFENLPRWNQAISETRQTTIGRVGAGDIFHGATASGPIIARPGVATRCGLRRRESSGSP